MRIKVKVTEALLRVSLLGSIANLLISPSHGMNLEEDGISSLPSIERRINTKNSKEFRGPSQKDVEELHRNIQSLNIQDVDLWVKAAEAGNITGLYHLGWFVDQKQKAKELLLEKDQPITSTLEKAKGFYWWKRAQDEKDPEAWFQLGVLYHSGQGVEKDYVEAMKWLRKAADQGFAMAQRNIGVSHLKGLGVKQDVKKAFEWFHKAPASLIGNEFSTCNFTDAAAPYIADLLSKAPHLNGIFLNGNKFTSQGLRPILFALQPHPNLSTLNISYNLINDEGGKELLAFYEKNPSLKEIDVDSNSMNKEINSFFRRRNSLNINPENICELKNSFSECNFTDTDADQVASLLSKAKPLSRIDLSHNKFTSQGLIPILAALQSHPNLVELNISHNLINDEGGKELLYFCEKNISLQRIWIFGNSMSKEMKASIETRILRKIINESGETHRG